MASIDSEALGRALRALGCEEDVEEVDSDMDNLSDAEEVLPIRGGGPVSEEEDGGDDGDEDFEPDDDQPSTSSAAMTTGRRRRGGGSSRPPAKRGKPTPLQWSKTPVDRSVQTQYNEDGYITNRQLGNNCTPLDCFLTLFQDRAFELMVKMTNRNYARKEAIRCQGRSSSNRRRSHQAEWRDTTVPEMKAFVGLMIAMGVDRKPRLTMYWRNPSSIFHSPGFGAVMTRDRFQLLYRHFHFCDPTEEQEAPTDRLIKIRKFMEMIRERCQSQYCVGGYLSIDESMVPFKGRLAFKQYLPAKRTRFGIKIWVLAESTTKYVTNFEVYLGKDPRQAPADGGSLGTMVVMRLMQNYLGVGRHLYMDNFYTCPDLLQKLYEQNTYACGTVRMNRVGFPKEMIIKVTGRNAKEPGYSDWLSSGRIVCFSWNDNKAVYVMTTIHETPTEHDVYDTVKRKKDKVLPCPPAICDYNEYMGGVDGNDQYRKYYNINRKSKIWYRKIFGYLLEVVVQNARILYETARGTKEDGVAFREALVHSLVANQRQGSSCPLVAVTNPFVDQPDLRFDMTRSHLVVSYSADGKAAYCMYCKMRLKNKSGPADDRVQKSTYKCETCNVPLCVNHTRQCFKLYHQR